MENDFKALAWKQYIHYFRIWFIILGILIVIAGGLFAVRVLPGKNGARGNNMEPEERVYDYANVLTNDEEQMLRDQIADYEARFKIDLVLVTIREDVESRGSWETVMRNKADDFYDGNNYGFNRVHGDGALLLDNWYEDANGSQKGSWLSTCGIVEDRFGNFEINKVLDDVYYKVDNSPYLAYKAYLDTTCFYVKARESKVQIPWLFIVIAPLIIAICYAIIHLSQKPAKDTATATEYIAGGKPVMKAESDTFMHKNVTTHIISTSSSSGGSGHSGGGGHHVSHSGVSHGGGGHRR